MDIAACKCTVEGRAQPTIPVSNPFIAMSNFATVLAGGLKVDEFTGWPAAAKQATASFCNLSYAAGAAQLAGTKAQYVASTCVTAVQATELLSK
jgi:hypothetical protein